MVDGWGNFDRPEGDGPPDWGGQAGGYGGPAGYSGEVDDVGPPRYGDQPVAPTRSRARTAMILVAVVIVAALLAVVLLVLL